MSWPDRQQRRIDRRRLTRLEGRVDAVEARVGVLWSWCELNADLLRVDPPKDQ